MKLECLVSNLPGISMELLESSDCTDESRKDETYLQFKIKKYCAKTLNYIKQ